MILSIHCFVGEDFWGDFNFRLLVFLKPTPLTLVCDGDTLESLVRTPVIAIGDLLWEYLASSRPPAVIIVYPTEALSWASYTVVIR